MKVPDLAARALALAPTELLVGGSWRAASGGGRFEVLNPATGGTLATVADADPADGMAALDAAAAAQPGWAATAPRVRSELLRAAFERLHELADEFSALMTLEMGKPLAESRAELAYGAEFLRWFAEEAVRINGRYTPSPEGNLRILTLQRPVGPALLITPWNFPLAMATRKVAPALAAGCTAILKPAELTPLTALAFGRVLQEVGVPPGVVGVLPTTRAGAVTAPMIGDQRLRKLSFTGSTAVGKALLRQAAGNVVRTSMELGGQAPFIVFGDADLDGAVAGAFQTKLRNMGEACNAANTCYVHASVAAEFSGRLAARFASLQLGDGLDPAAQVGPLISAAQRERLHTLVRGAVDGGAGLLTGGAPLDGPGYFYRPTVLTGVRAGDAIVGEEIFGPVAPVVAFETEEEVVALANASQVGLAAYVHTADMSRVLRLSETLQVGMLGVNGGTISNVAAPFGGVKHSGLGREGGAEGIAAYLETVYLGLPDPFVR